MNAIQEVSELDSHIARAIEVARQLETEREERRAKERQEAIEDCMAQIPAWMHPCVRHKGTSGTYSCEVVLELAGAVVRLTRTCVPLLTPSYEWRYWSGSTWSWAACHEEAIAGAVDAGSPELPGGM